MSALDAAPLTLRPAPLGDGSSSRCEIYADEVAPLSSAAAVPPETDTDLVEWIDLLRDYPVNRAATELRRRQRARTAPPAVELGARHRIPDQPSAPADEPPTAAAAAVEPTPAREQTLEDPAFDEILVDRDDVDYADDTYVYLPTEADFQVDKKGRRNFHFWATEGNAHVATDGESAMFTDEAGEWIYTTNKGVEIRGGQPKALLDKLTNLIKSGGASTEPLSDELPDLYDENGAPVEHFAVPVVGRPVGVVSEKARGSRRMVFTVCATTVVGVGGLLLGTLWGRSAVPAEAAISAAEAQTYRLSGLPIAAMSAFGQQYLETCLTHGDRDQMKARSALLAQMSTGGASPGCGWTEGGEQQTPLSVGFTGRWKPIDGVFDTGNGIYLDYLVSTRHGQFSTYTVPVWIKSAASSNNMSVIGDIGNVPGMQISTPEEYEPSTEADPQLAANLQVNLVEPYLAAWAASNRTQIDLAVASDATPNAKRGLRRTVKNPEIVSTLAYSSAAAGDGQPGQYGNGDTAELVVTVTWTIPASNADLPDSTQTSGYRISVVRTGDKWLVSDINGGAVNPRAADGNSNAGTADSGQEPGIAGITPGATGGPVEETSEETPKTSEPSVDNQLAPATSIEP